MKYNKTVKMINKLIRLVSDAEIEMSFEKLGKITRKIDKLLIKLDDRVKTLHDQAAEARGFD